MDRAIFYSIVRFCPNKSKGEFVNIGLILYDFEKDSFGNNKIFIKMSEDNSKIYQVFGKNTGYDEEQLNSIKESFVNKIYNLGPKYEIWTLHQFRKTLANDIIMTKFKEVRVLSEDIKIEGEKLFKEIFKGEISK